MIGPVEKTCARCAQRFECGQYRCWCGMLGITDRQMDWISARFEDCLCRVCLGQVCETVGPGPSGRDVTGEGDSPCA